jgi:allantoin racemase
MVKNNLCDKYKNRYLINIGVRILYVNPVGTNIFDREMERILLEVAEGDTEVNVVSLKRGPWHLEYHYYESLILVDMLHLIKKAEQEGYDAAVIGCFYDIGLHEAREVSERIVITAPAEATMLTACSLGDKFSIVVGRKKWIPQMMSNVVRYGLKDRLASFKPVELGVLDFQKRQEETKKRLYEAAKEAVNKDGAEVIILGCTAEFGFWKTLQERLKVPILDAVITPFKYAEYLVTLKNKFGWMHSKIGGFETPPLEEIEKWNIEKQYNTDVWSSAKNQLKANVKV